MPCVPRFGVLRQQRGSLRELDIEALLSEPADPLRFVLAVVQAPQQARRQFFAAASAARARKKRPSTAMRKIHEARSREASSVRIVCAISKLYGNG